MLKSRLMALLCIAAGLGSANAQAQEVNDWSGFYAGVFGGFNAGDVNYDIISPTGTALYYGNPEINGLFGGADAGVNYQLDNGFVVGAEADIAASSTEGAAQMYDAATGSLAHSTVQKTVNSMASLRARAGFAVDRFLPFVTGGVALAQTSFENVVTGSTPPFTLPGLEDVQLGWTVGAGLEYAVTENISARAEYRFSQFDGSEKASPALSGNEKAAFHTHDARIGLNYHF
jgi:outer membrane immunogenic protein